MIFSSTSNIIEAMNNILLEYEEEEELAFEMETGDQASDVSQDSMQNYAYLGRFLVDGVIDLPSMKQTMAVSWRPGERVFIKEVDEFIFFLVLPRGKY